jgi:hypothetical protein
VPGRVGQKLIAKQLPDFPFLMDAQLHNRFMKAFKGEWDLFKAIDTTHLLAIGTFGVSPNGVASLEELSVIVVDEHWLPIESMFEKELVEKLTDQKRCFLKVLRYNLASDIPVAAAVLLDTRPKGVAMYIIPPALADDEEYKKGLEELIMASTLDAWVWLPGQGEMPPLPGLTEEEHGSNPTLPMPVKTHSSPEPFPADSSSTDAAAPIPAEAVRAPAAAPIETIPPVPEESIHETPTLDMSDLPF